MDAMAGYTKDQIVLYYEKAVKLDAQRRLRFLSDVRTAVWADGKGMNEHVAILAEGAEVSRQK
jgi:hypothetical protein